MSYLSFTGGDFLGIFFVNRCVANTAVSLFCCFFCAFTETCYPKSRIKISLKFSSFVFSSSFSLCSPHFFALSILYFCFSSLCLFSTLPSPPLFNSPLRSIVAFLFFEGPTPWSIYWVCESNVSSSSKSGCQTRQTVFVAFRVLKNNAFW